MMYLLVIAQTCQNAHATTLAILACHVNTSLLFLTTSHSGSGHRYQPHTENIQTYLT